MPKKIKGCLTCVAKWARGRYLIRERSGQVRAIDGYYKFSIDKSCERPLHAVGWIFDCNLGQGVQGYGYWRILKNFYWHVVRKRRVCGALANIHYYYNTSPPFVNSFFILFFILFITFYLSPSLQLYYSIEVALSQPLF